jgi:hypothetical protein
MLTALALLLWLFGVSLADAEKHHSHEKLAHPHDPVLQAEHMDMLYLVGADSVTHTAVRDGRWSEPATWKDGKVPTANANALIPTGKAVTVDTESAVALRTLRIDGTLRFAADRDTSLLVDTIVVPPAGQLIMGTAEAPIARERRARIIFADRGPIDTEWDPNLLSRGLIAHGVVSMTGAEVTPFRSLKNAPRQGDTRLVLSQAPTNWKRGDRLVLTGTHAGAGKGAGQTQDEELTVLAIAGAEVTVRPLDHDHTAPAGMSVYLANLSRNVTMESQNTAELSRHGHAMFMHSPRVKLSYAGFYDLGRTDKRIAVNDPRLDAHRKLIAGSGTNPRGRYPVHFHRTGVDAQVPAIPVKGCAVVNSPGWGYVNHSGYVEFEDNVAYNVHGSGFVTEAGNEIGSFRRNLAIRSAGSGHDPVARVKVQDFGHEGNGFWLQGGGVRLEHNIAAGQREAGFFFFSSGLIEDGLGRMGFALANVPEPLRVNNVKSPKENQPPDRMTLNYLPLLSFKGNTAFACRVGIIVRFHSPPKTESVIEDCTVWRTSTGVRILYSDNIRLRNLRLIGGGDKNAAMGVAQGSEAIGGAVYENLHVEGWQTGISVSDIIARPQVIQGGYYDNQVNIAIALCYGRTGVGRVDEIKGDIRFGASSKRDIALTVNYDNFYSRDPNALFAPNAVRLDTPKYRGKQLYYVEQGADHVPLKDVASGKFRSAATGHVPAELIGKTNKELWQKYGLAIAGAVAPADVATDPRIDGLIGAPSTAPHDLVLHNVYSRQLQGYRPSYSDPAGAKKQGGIHRHDLRAGWNVVTEKINDQPRSFLVFGGADKPGYVKKGDGDYNEKPDKKPKPQAPGDEGAKPKPKPAPDKNPKP